MTTISEEPVTCVFCEETTVLPVLGSTSSFGPPDLDLRPSEPARSSIFAWVQRCAFCGYCAPSIGVARPGASHVVDTPEYGGQLVDAEYPPLANSFLCSALIFSAVGEAGLATRSAIEAAWVCDDAGALQAAQRCRMRAVDLLLQSRAEGDEPFVDPATESAVLVDLLRRSERFEEAVEQAVAALPDAEGTVRDILAFSRDLAIAHDASAYTIEAALAPPAGASMSAGVPTPLGDRFDAALAYATVVHAGQPRKGTRIPYIAHLLAVAALVLEDGGSEEEAIAALLHDAVEDRGGAGRLADIETRFGAGVAGVVHGCSDTDTIPKPPWRERKERYITHLQSADPRVVRVSLADKVHNARALLLDYREHEEDLWPRFDPESDQLWYYRALANVFRAVSDSRLVAELERLTTELEDLVVSGALRKLCAHGSASDAVEYVALTLDNARNYYIQFTVDGGLVCEVTQHEDLRPEDELTSDDFAKLLALGFQELEAGTQNRSRIFYPKTEQDYLEIVRFCRTLSAELFGLPPGLPIEISASWR
jgi:GTP pyrophosphokinase